MTNIQIKTCYNRLLYCEDAHNSVFGWKHLAISKRWFLGPIWVLNANGILVHANIGLNKKAILIN